jgi:hypothetical protein
MGEDTKLSKRAPGAPEDPQIQKIKQTGTTPYPENTSPSLQEVNYFANGPPKI